MLLGLLPPITSNSAGDSNLNRFTAQYHVQVETMSKEGSHKNRIRNTAKLFLAGSSCPRLQSAHAPLHEAQAMQAQCPTHDLHSMTWSCPQTPPSHEEKRFSPGGARGRGTRLLMTFRPASLSCDLHWTSAA